MRNFYAGVVKYRKTIMIAFMVIAVVCAILQRKVFVDYDILDYLPTDSPSTKSLEVMKEEFGSNIPNTQIMIRNVDRSEALRMKEKIEATDGVISVNWLDSMVPLNMPPEMFPESLKDTYYKDGNALFIVTVDEEKKLDTIPALYDLIGEDNPMTGTAVITVVATINTVKEIIVITIISILFLLFVLMMTTESWVEPFVVLFGLGIAVVINMGTNIIFGTISFVTNSAGMILQMALSIDYSVFLIHRFDECRVHAEPEEAMTEALTLSSSSILSSGLTTVIGFVALATMRFLIGADLGLALSKGVAISLITSLIFMPGVILLTYKLMERTRHRKFMPSFVKFGGFVRKVTVPLMIVFMLLSIPAFYCSTHNNYWYGGSHIYGPNTKVGSDGEKIEEVFGNNDTFVMMVPRGDNEAEYALIRDLEDLEDVRTVLSPVSVIGSALPSEMLPDSVISQLRSEKYDRLAISVAVPAESEETFALIDEIYKLGDKYYPDEYYLAGTGVSNYDLKKVVTSDMVKVNLIAVLAVFLVLVLTMKNLVLPLILVLTIETAIWVNMSITYVTGSTLFYLAYLIISSIQLGATVDYAILYTQRYRENRITLGLAPKDCIVATISDTTVSILVSATAVSVMGFLLSIFSSQGMIAQVGLLLGRGTLCSLFAVLFVLPGLLATFDKFVMRSFEPVHIKEAIHRREKIT